MRRKTLEEELESILEIDEWEFEDERGIESFKEFMTERIGFGPIVKDTLNKKKVIEGQNILTLTERTI